MKRLLRQHGREGADDRGAAIRTFASLRTGLWARRVMVWVTIALVMVGCGTAATVNQAYPPDLSLVVTVQPGAYASTDDPTRAPAQYVVQSDRTLRVAWGPNVHHQLYPPTTTAVLRPREMTALHAIVERHELTEAESTDGEGDEPRYQVEITADGATHRYTTTPSASPGTEKLVRRLAGFYRGGL